MSANTPIPARRVETSEPGASTPDASKPYFHASDHLFTPGDLIVPGIDVDKVGLSGGPASDSWFVWMQDDVHDLLSYGDRLYEVQPIGETVEVFPHVHRAARARVIREIRTGPGSEYRNIAERLRRA